MAWVTVPRSNSIWQYDNAPTLGTLATGAKVHADDQYYRANGTVTAGIRSFTPPGGNLQQTYVKCRMIGDGNDNGPWSELSKNYYDSTTSVYAILSFEPKLAFDFKNNYYSKSESDSTFPASITHTASTNATMVDSDGLLKWRPHNNITKSNTFSTWTKISSTAVDNAVDGPTGIANTASTVNFTSTNSLIYNLSTVAVRAGDKVTFAAWVRSDTITSLTFAVNGRTATPNNTPETNLAVTSTWTLVTFEFTVLANDTGLYFLIGKYNAPSPLTQIGVFEIYGAHIYRSDLGGMVNNSEQPTGFGTYVPTTTTAVYGPRVGHHIYNGTAWVNEGIRHESEARTNICLYSNDSTNWLSYPAGSFTLTGAQAVGSDGTSSLTKVAITDTVNEAHEVYTTYDSLNPSLGLTLSADFKDGNQRFVMLRQYISSSDWFAVTFDLVTGTVTQESVGPGSTFIRDSGVIDLSNGLYRCWVSYEDSVNAASAGNPTVDAVTTGTPTLNTSGSEIYSGIAGTHFFLGAMQLEVGATPSSYIPTSGSAVTRAADLLTVPAANLPYDNTNMSIQIDGKMTYADNGLYDEVEPYRWLLNATNYISAGVSTQAGMDSDSLILRPGQGVFNQRQSTSGYDSVAGTNNDYSPGANVPFSLASRHGSTFLNGAVEGTALTVDTTPTVLPDLSSTDLNLGYNFMGTIGQFRVWDEDLTDAGIIEATN